MKTLNAKIQDLPEGSVGRVRFIAGPPWFRQRMYEFGLLPGVEVRVVKRAPLGGPVVLEFLTQRIALSPREANWIHVDVM